MTHNEETAASAAPEYHNAYDENTRRSANLAYLLLQFRNSKDVLDEVEESIYLARKFLTEN